MRRSLAAAVIAMMLLASTSGCSHPIDTGSPVPAQDQPLIALLALVGLGVAYAAFVHHGSSHVGGGSSALVAPFLVLALAKPGIDLAVDPTLNNAGVLENASGSFQFEEIDSNTHVRVGYALPSGYAPTAVAIDAQGNDWFVDAAGAVDKCAPPSGAPTCVPLLTFNDGLTGTDGRSIAADQFFVFVARADGAGTASWTAVPLAGGTAISGTYGYSGLGLSSDAVTATTFGAGTSSFTLFHLDGNSYVVSLPSSATKSPFVLQPLPSFAPGNIFVARDSLGDQLYFGALGSPASAYQIAAWIGTNGVGVTAGSLRSAITIASGGRINASQGVYAPPCRSIHTDAANDVFMLDSGGALVGFAAFSQ